MIPPYRQLWPWILPLILLVVGGIYRWDGLDGPCLNWDEANQVAIAQLPVMEIIRVLSIRDFHPSGNPLLLHGWIDMVGNSDLAVRSFSWLFGMLGLWGSYLLAMGLTESKRIANLVLLFGIASPFLVSFSLLATPYGVYYAAWVFSWWFLLRVLRDKKMMLANHAGYFVVTLLTAHLHATGISLLILQMSYLGFHRRLFAKSKWLLALLILVGLSWLPFYFNTLQPWHISHHSDVARIHQVTSGWMLALTPANFLWLATENLLPGARLPSPLAVILGGLLAYIILGWGLFQMRQSKLSYWQELLWLGLAPLLLAMLLSVVSGKPLFQFRTLLPCIFAMHVVLAWVVTQWAFSPEASRFKKVLGVVCVLFFLCLQLDRVQAIRAQGEDPWRGYAQATRKIAQPGDGIVLYPGWSHLGFTRYYDPNAFGLTEREIRMNPKTDNLYHMIHRADSQMLAFSGDDVVARPETQQLLRQFVATHRRVLLVGFHEGYLSLLNCKKHVLVLNQDGQFTPFVCLTPEQLKGLP